MKKIFLAATMVLSLGAGMAQALPVAYTTPGSNDANPNSVLGDVDGYLNANLYLFAGQAVAATIEFIGKEAGNTNKFYFQNNLIPLYSTDTAPYDQNGPVAVGLTNVMINPGLLNFKFTTSSGKPDAVNGSNVLPDANPQLTNPNFFVSLGSGANFLGNEYNANNVDGDTNGFSPLFGTTVIIAFDDAGGNNQSDDNHDDLVVRITLVGSATQFSTPDGGATLALLGGALMGLGMLRRKFKA